MSDETVPRLGHLEDARNSRTSPKVLWSYRRTVSCGNGVSAVRRRVKHTPQKEGKNCWPASWRGSNYSNDSGRLRFPSSSFFSSSSSSAQKRFNCRNRFTAKMRLRAVMLASHNPFLISDTIFQDSYQIFLFRLLSFRLSQSYCCFGVLIG